VQIFAGAAALLSMIHPRGFPPSNGVFFAAIGKAAVRVSETLSSGFLHAKAARAFVRFRGA